MDKLTKQRDPKRQAAGRKGHEKYMAKLKEDILKNVGNDSTSNSSSSGTNSTSNSSSSGTNSTSNSSSSTNFSYIHGVGAIAVLALGVCIFITPKLMPSQRDKDPISKEPEKISKIRRKML